MLNGYNFNFVVEYFQFKPTALHKIHHVRQDSIRIALIITDTANPYRRQLPLVIIANLSYGYVELIPEPADDGLDYLSFILER